MANTQANAFQGLDTDVLIVGASMAGSCLARQLSLARPELKITVIDGKETFESSVGESTIEVFDDYAIRNLKLGPYLAKNHITKHGLRFWFDSPEKNLPLCEMSEQGRSRYTALNRGIQLNRQAFDRDLVDINRQGGVDVRLGVRVLHTHELEGDGAYEINPAEGHLVHTSQGDIRCRYLVDAAGRQSPLALQLDLLDKAHVDRAKGAYWARFKGTCPIDELGDDAWRERVDNTLRWASTNHFMYDGYWIWLIPLTAEVVSIGVTFDHDLQPLALRDGDELIAFLRGHRAFDELLGSEAELVDFHGLHRITRGVTRFYSTDRWFLSGVAGLFVDPLFSSACGLLALANTLICSMIASCEDGEQAVFERQVSYFNSVMRHVFLRQLDSFSNYHLLGSFDAFVNWQTLRYHTILNYEVPMQRADYRPLLEQAKVAEALPEDQWTESQQLGIASDRLVKEFVAFVDERGEYHARNCGYYHEKTERNATREKCVHPTFGDEVRKESLLNWEAFYRYYLQRMCDLDKVAFDEGVFQRMFNPDWQSEQTLAEIFDVLVSGEGGGAESGELVQQQTWDLKGPIDEHRAAGEDWWYRFLDPSGRSLYARPKDQGQ